MHQETELFFDDLVKNEKSLLDLITADYTFVNEPLARHYGIKGVSGEEFRKVQLPRRPSGPPGRGLHPPP